MSDERQGYQPRQYLMTSEQLLTPEVGAVEIGLLETGKFDEVAAKMKEMAEQKGIKSPKMIVDLIFKEGKRSLLGSPGQPYSITKEEWEVFVKDVPEYSGDLIPKVYMVDGSKFTTPI